MMRAPSKSKRNRSGRSPRAARASLHATTVGRADVEHEEAAAARAHELPADGARLASDLVVLVDVRVGHVRGELSLVRPVLVQHLAVGVDLAGEQDALGLVAELLDAVHPLDRGVLVLDDRLGLLLEHGRSGALDARVVDDEVGLELVDHLVLQREALDLDGAIGPERQRADAAVGRDVLVLLADRLLEELDLELAGLARELLGGHELALERVQAVEQGDGEAARRAEAGVGRYVGQAVQLEAVGDARHAQRRLEDAVPDLVDRVDDLALGIREANRVLEALRDADEHELVDRSGYDEAAVFARVAGEVGAASPERKAHGRARYDHGEGFLR